MSCVRGRKRKRNKSFKVPMKQIFLLHYVKELLKL